MKKEYIKPEFEPLIYEQQELLTNSGEQESTSTSGEWLPGFFD